MADLDDNWALPAIGGSPSAPATPGLNLQDSWKLPSIPSAPAPKPKDESTPKYGSFMDNVKGDLKFTGRELAIAGRGALQGAESLPLMALDAGTGAVNLAKQGLSKLGLDDDPTMAPMPSQVNDQGLTAMGVPAPQNAGEQGLAMTAGALVGARLPQGQMPETPGAPLAPPTQVPIAGQTAGQVTGNENLQSIESTLARAPGGGPIRQAITTQKNNLVGGVQDIVDSLAGSRGTTPYSVGSAMDSGIKQGAKDLKDLGGKVFDAVDAAVPKDLDVNPTVTKQVLDTFTKIDPNAPATSALLKDPRLAAIRTALEKDLAPTGAKPAQASTILGADGKSAFTTPAVAGVPKAGIPYTTMKSLVSDLGNQIDWTGMNGDASNGALKQVYIAMRNDLSSAASGVSPELAAGVKAANKNWGDVKDRMDALTNATSGAGGPEQIFNRLMSGAKSGPSGLSNVMDVLSDSNQKLLAAGFIQKLGRSPGAAQNAAGDAFDADTFFNNWGKMDPGAKNRLFGSLPQEYRKNMDTLVSNAKALKAYQNVLPNSSNTAKASVWGTSLGIALTSLLHGDVKTAAIAAGGAPAATALMSRVLTNPKVVAYLARKSNPAKVLGISGATAGAYSAAQ